jgi:Pyruvate/2-oxoacid:ferredoxin oxidoreductase gamma subunit
MSPTQPMLDHPLARHRGRATLSGAEAVVKGVLECFPNVHVLSLVDTPSQRALIKLLREPAINDLLRMHRLRLLISSTATRAMEEALWAARDSKHVIAMLGGPTACDALAGVLADPPILKSDSALGCIIEDAVDVDGSRSPTSMCARSTLPTINASDVEHLRDSVEHGLRLSRADGTPTVTLAHPSIFQSGSTIVLRPNRSAGDEASAARRRPNAPRWTESGGALRMARRLELNTHRALPSPGDPSPVGFITVGPADRALRQITDVFGLAGRVPVLHLGLVQPIDESAIDRILIRCQRVVVLEPEPGLIESEVLRCIERHREDGATRAILYGQHLPDAEDGASTSSRPQDELHPSLLARRIMPLLETLQPSLLRSRMLVDEPPAIPDALTDTIPLLGDAGHDHAVDQIAEHVFDSVTETGQWLLDVVSPEEDDSASTPRPIRMHFNGRTAGPGDGREVHLETWSYQRFLRQGPALVNDLAREPATRVLLVAQHAAGRSLERLARSAVPAGATETVTIRSGNLADRERLLQQIQELIRVPGLIILLLNDGPPVQFDVTTLETAIDEIDKLGFQPIQRIIWPADRSCVIRQPLQQAEHEVLAARQAMPAETNWLVQTLPNRWPPRFSGRIRPLLEQVEVHRSRAPKRLSIESTTSGLPVPTPRHADAACWRIHLAGLRGDTPGVAMRLLEAAGTSMDYQVRWTIDPTPIGPGRRAWAQVAFTRHRDDVSDPPTGARVPFGEADVLLGFDRSATLKAVSTDPTLRVANRDRTAAVINTGNFEDQLDLKQAGEDVDIYTAFLEDLLEHEACLFEDFADGCRFRFHNERLADVVQLGAAFQLGLIPVTVDAMIAATKSIESSGHARTIEAFEFGRRIAIDPSALRRPGEDPHAEDVDRITRRYGHVFRRSGPGRLPRAARFRKLVQRSIGAMPGLSETQSGREALLDFVIALRRCTIWGGTDEAERLLDLVIALYRSDRGDRGRLLTRLAILPLAESMLIRDAVYMSTMVASPEHRRRTRLRLNIKRGRGDRIERRYVTRFELVFVRWRFRVDLRTSDWVTRMLAVARHVLPRNWRGTARERDVRTAVRDIVQNATLNPDQYDEWVPVLETMHAMALDGRLRRSTASQIKALRTTSSSD